jgi:hypothetical protein
MRWKTVVIQWLRGVERGVAAAPSRNQLFRVKAVRASVDPVNTLGRVSTKTLAVKRGALFASRINVFCVRPAVPFRANTLCDTVAVAPDRTATAAPGLS